MYPFVDIIYIVVLVPTLIYLGLKKNKAPAQLYNFALLLGVLILVYHISNLADLVEDENKFTPVEDRLNTPQISNNIIY
tara:strand:+ start:1031 stop:1267 length:237 start_codon:yes stop_codon:yes gene_type:complete